MHVISAFTIKATFRVNGCTHEFVLMSSFRQSRLAWSSDALYGYGDGQTHELLGNQSMILLPKGNRHIRILLSILDSEL
jgi:hypothetical protein